MMKKIMIIHDGPIDFATKALIQSGMESIGFQEELIEYGSQLSKYTPMSMLASLCFGREFVIVWPVGRPGGQIGDVGGASLAVYLAGVANRASDLDFRFTAIGLSGYKLCRDKMEWDRVNPIDRALCQCDTISGPVVMSVRAYTKVIANSPRGFHLDTNRHARTEFYVSLLGKGRNGPPCYVAPSPPGRDMDKLFFEPDKRDAQSAESLRRSSLWIPTSKKVMQ